MENIKNKINYIYQHLFNCPIHPFFRDIRSVNMLAHSYIDYQKDKITNKIDYKNTVIPENVDRNNKYSREVSINDLNQINNELNKVSNWNKIFKIISTISIYVIKSNVSDEEKLYDSLHKDKGKKNIAIIGSGPIGLFLGCYLELYYNRGSLNNYPKVNIVVFDSRIEKPGLRKPYTRQRPFATSSKYLSLLVPKIYSWDNNKERNSIFINIFILEYILYTKAILEYNLPIVYNDYDWNDYKQIFKKGNFQVVFDCTGGRLKTDLFKNIDTTWMDNINKIDKVSDKQLMIIPENNLVHLIDYPKDKKFKQNHFYCSLTTVKDDKEFSFVNKFDIDITNEKDLMFLNKLKKKYYTLDSIFQIISNIIDDTNRNYLYSILIKYKEKYNTNLFSFDVWAIYIRHALQVAETFNIDDKKLLYIGAGDTIFHSHFITGAGLNRTINFSVKCANYMIDI